jgi:hypothetical protein
MAIETHARPLGVRPEVVLDDGQLHTLQVLADYDLGRVRSRLLREGAMPASWLDDAILEFRRYLGLRALEGQPLLMFSKQIDDVWHACLLFSRVYADLCQQAFGQFVHHEPADGPEPDLEARWREFEAAYRRVYGEPHRLWRMGRASEHTGDHA